MGYFQTTTVEDEVKQPFPDKKCCCGHYKSLEDIPFLHGYITERDLN